MAQSSKTFAGSTLTPSGDAAVSGSALTVAAATSYSDDFESYSIGATPTGMTTVSATATVQSSSGQQVMRCVGASWAGVYYTGSTFTDGCFLATALAVGGRMNPCARYSSSAAKGYPLQLLASFVQMGNSLPTNFVSLNSPLRVQQDGITMPSTPWTTKLQTYTEAGGNVQVRMWLNDVLRFDYLDSINKWPAGNLAAELFAGTTDYSIWSFYPVKTGGFTTTLTPLSVTSLTRIVIEWDNENSVPKRTSEVFEYQIDGGSWTAVPDSGYINAACTSTIGIRANSTLKNGYDSTGAVTVNSVAVEIAGQWDAYVPPSVSAPTSLAAGTPTSSSIPLTWTDAASPAAFYDVYQSTSLNGTYTLVEVATQGDQAVTVYGLSASTTYYFKLKSRSAEGATSSFTSAVSATTPAASGIPDTPTAFAATTTGRSTIRLTWTDGATTASLLVYRHTSDSFGAASVISGVDAGTQVFNDSGLASGTQYYYWLLPLGTGGEGTQTSSVNATTYGAAGNPGDDIVSQIVTSAKSRLSSILSADFSQLKWVRDLKKNEHVPWGYGVEVGSEEPSEPSVFGSYTSTLSLQVVLYRNPSSIQNDRDVETATLALHQWKDRVHRDFTTTRLYENDVIVRIGDPETEVEYLEDAEVVALRLTFPVIYRNSRI